MAEPDRPEVSDEALVESARSGNARSFEQLLHRHESRVLRVLHLLGVPGQDREDVAQEVFLRVFRHLAGYRPGGSFGAWIYRVTVNSAHDFRLKQGRARRDEVPWTARAGEVADPSDGPEAAAGRAGDRVRLELALESLTERERAVFVLKELEGLDSRETARILGVTTITVRRHLGLARHRLREALKGDGPR